MKKLLVRKNWPLLATIVLLAATVWALRAQGRIWFCECQQLRFWTSEADGRHTSQHLADPYTFSHLQHGLLLFFAAKWLFPRWKWQWQWWWALAVEAAWEIFENSSWVIDRYRQTAALGYNGDSVLNSVGDIVACGLGLYVAHRLGWRATCVLFVAIEVVMLLTIRDSLLLNIVMLLMPLEAIKQWQLAA